MDANGNDRMINASTDSKTLRPRFGRVLVIVCVALALLFLVSLAFTDIRRAGAIRAAGRSWRRT